jgi:hypothetical protein
MDIQCNYHLPYNPTAAGNIERHNGLLKLKLAHLSDKALEIACFEPNSRNRLYRRSPLEEEFPKYWTILSKLHSNSPSYLIRY